jgi:hypothetical protein
MHSGAIAQLCVHNFAGMEFRLFPQRHLVARKLRWLFGHRNRGSSDPIASQFQLKPNFLVPELARD